MPTSELKKILYVDDEPDIATIAKLALETVGGFDVSICENGKSALEQIEGLDPDLVLLDVMMPDMDGPTTLMELRRLPAFKHTPVVFMTAKVQPSEILHYKELGAVDVIPKPFDPMALSDQVRHLWNSVSS